MSAPRLFWMAMLSSGVSSMRLPSTGDWNVTPVAAQGQAVHTAQGQAVHTVQGQAVHSVHPGSGAHRQPRVHCSPEQALVLG
jgi:hypothetical protein